MSPDHPCDRTRLITLILLISGSVASLLHILFAPLRPPLPLSNTPLEYAITGYRLEGIENKAKILNGRDLSFSGIRSFRIESNKTSPMYRAEISIVNVHSRSHKKFQVAAFGSSNNSPLRVRLADRMIYSSKPNVAIGDLIKDDAKVSGQGLQTCLVTNTTLQPYKRLSGGVTSNELTIAKRPIQDRGWQRVWDELNELSGFKPNVEWQCLFVSISTTQDGPEGKESLLRFWDSAAPVLGSMAP